MKKLFTNIGLVALGCIGAHAVTGHIDVGTIVVGLVTCLASNLVGLYQNPPEHG